MNAFELIKNEYINNAEKYKNAEKIESHPCKYVITEVKKAQKTKEKKE